MRRRWLAYTVVTNSARANTSPYATIRTAKAAPGAASEIASRIEKTFAPTISGLPGFIGYYGVAAAEDTFATISLFTNQASAEESNRKASEWVKQNLAGLVLTPLQFVTGEVLVNKAA